MNKYLEKIAGKLDTNTKNGVRATLEEHRKLFSKELKKYSPSEGLTHLQNSIQTMKDASKQFRGMAKSMEGPTKDLFRGMAISHRGSVKTIKNMINKIKI